jgi:HAMP domain-containing protein
MFLLAAVLPAMAVAGMYTAMADAALRREAASRLASESAAYSNAIGALLDASYRSLSLIASDPAVLYALSAEGREQPSALSKALRTLLAAFPRNEGLAEASVYAADGSLALSIADTPADRALPALGNWGIFRKLSLYEHALEPRLGTLSDGSASAYTLGVALRDDEGALLGYALADLRRQVLSQAAMASGLSGSASIIFPSGKVVFDQYDPGNEGFYIYELGVERSYGSYAEAVVPNPISPFRVRINAPQGFYEGFADSARNLALIGLGTAAALALALALGASRNITEPVLELAASMKKVEAGDLSARTQEGRDDELGELARSFNAMTEELQNLLAARLEQQELLRSAELRALAAQMNPHFLHNTLASIKSLAKLGRSAEIAELVSRLGKILRAGATRRDGMSTLGESLSLVEDYLRIEKLRFGKRFSYAIDVPKTLYAMNLPPLSIEPLVENALTHGLERKPGTGSLSIRAELAGAELRVRIDDDGPGMEKNALKALQQALACGDAPGGSHGIGILGTNRRLRLAYGASYGLSISAADEANGRGLSVLLRVPAREGA